MAVTVVGVVGVAVEADLAVAVAVTADAVVAVVVGNIFEQYFWYIHI